MLSFPHFSILSCILASDFFDSVVKVLFTPPPSCFQKKKSALFEVAEVLPVMTNNYEENILRGVRDSSYSLESSIELLQKDVVQLHAPRYQSMRRVSPQLLTEQHLIRQRDGSNVMMLHIKYVHWCLLIDDWQKHI